MKNKCITLIILLFTLIEGYSQNNVGIGTTTPDSNSILELKTTDKGILIPRMTSIQRNNMSPLLGLAQKGLLVFDNDSTNFFYWNGFMWQSIGSGAMGPQGLPGAANVQLYGVNSSHSTNICTSTYTIVPDLIKTINLTDTATIDILTTGGIYPNNGGNYYLSPAVYVSIYCNNIILPQTTQNFFAINSSWAITTIKTLPPGTYTFDVRAKCNQGCILAGSSANLQSSLIIHVFY